jgi:hypothetical protein
VIRSPGITVGMAIAVLLTLFDVTLPFGGDGRPFGLAVAGLVLGLLTVAGVVLHAIGRGSGAAIVIATRLLASVASLPTLIVGDVPITDRLFAALIVVLTLMTVLLLAPAMKAWTRMPRRAA